MALFAWIVFGHLAFAEAPQSLVVETADRSFTIVLEDSHLFFRSSAANGALLRSACNESLITSFWNEAVGEIRHYPKIKGGTLKPAAVVNGQRHLLRSLREPTAVTTLDRKFQSLQIQEAIQCKRK